MSVCIVWYYVVCSGQAFAGSLGSIHYLSVFPRGGLFICSLLCCCCCCFLRVSPAMCEGCREVVKGERERERPAFSLHISLPMFVLLAVPLTRKRKQKKKSSRLKVTSTTKVGANAILDHLLFAKEKKKKAIVQSPPLKKKGKKLRGSPSALCLGSQGLEDDPPPTHPPYNNAPGCVWHNVWQNVSSQRRSVGRVVRLLLLLLLSLPVGDKYPILIQWRNISFNTFQFISPRLPSHSTMSAMPPAARSADTSTDALLQQIPSTLGALQEQQHAFQAEVARRLDSMSATVTALERFTGAAEATKELAYDNECDSENWACRSSPLQSSHFRREMLSSPICVYLECTSF
eukprot:gene7912-5527_t